MIQSLAWLRLAAALTLSSLLVHGCSSENDSEPEAPTETCPFDYGSFDGQTPSVSFASDVLPIFRRSCGLSSVCHQTASGAADLYLGPKCEVGDRACQAGAPDTAELGQLIDALKQASQTATELQLVAPGSPETSFLMLKMDGCHDAASASCKALTGAKSGSACGDRMPQTGDILPRSDRDTVRRWIAQGAPNN